jgi:hypothetical protein
MQEELASRLASDFDTKYLNEIIHFLFPNIQYVTDHLQVVSNCLQRAPF